MPGWTRFLMVMLSRPWSSFSPQKVRKTSITFITNGHHTTPSVQVRGPLEGKRAGQEVARMAFTPRLSSVRPAGPTHITAGHRPKASAAQDSWRRPFAKVLSSSTDDIQAIRDLIELIREHAALKSRVVLAMMASDGAVRRRPR
jgi:hypothetical protein